MKVYNCNCFISEDLGQPGLGRLPLVKNNGYYWYTTPKAKLTMTLVYAKIEEADKHCYGYLANESL